MTDSHQRVAGIAVQVVPRPDPAQITALVEYWAWPDSPVADAGHDGQADGEPGSSPRTWWELPVGPDIDPHVLSSLPSRMNWTAEVRDIVAPLLSRTLVSVGGPLTRTALAVALARRSSSAAQFLARWCELAGDVPRARVRVERARDSVDRAQGRVPTPQMLAGLDEALARAQREEARISRVPKQKRRRGELLLAERAVHEAFLVRGRTRARAEGQEVRAFSTKLATAWSKLVLAVAAERLVAGEAAEAVSGAVLATCGQEVDSWFAEVREQQGDWYYERLRHQFGYSSRSPSDRGPALDMLEFHLRPLVEQMQALDRWERALDLVDELRGERRDCELSAEDLSRLTAFFAPEAAGS